MKNLKLFVWDDVLCDWTCGHISVLSSSVEQAREVVRSTVDECDSQSTLKVFTEEPTIYTDPVAILCWGGS